MLDAKAKVVPGRTVVAGPGRRIALTAGIGSAGHHERPDAGAQAKHPLERAARILHSIDVVNLRMGRVARGEVVTVDPVQIIERHGLGRRFEHRWLVHVVPEAGKPVGDEILVQAPPPVAAGAAREVGKHGWSRPHGRDVERTVRLADEMMTGEARFERRIALVRRISDVEVGDRDQANAVGV